MLSFYSTKEYLKNKNWLDKVVYTSDPSTLEVSQVDFYEFKANLIYIANFSSGRAT